ELRRRRAIGHGGAGLRLARPDDLGAAHPRRQDGRGRSRARHRDATLSRAPEGQGDLDQLDRVDLRLDERARPPRQARRQSDAREIRRHAGEGLRGHRRGRQHDQGPRAPGRRRPALAFDDRLPRQGLRQPDQGDGSVMTMAGTRTIAFALLLSAPLAGAIAAEAPLPAAIAASGETVVLTVHAVGMQYYDCKPGADGKLVWTFNSPQATLTTADKVAGYHGAGPTWELMDGSGITGKAVANSPGTNPNDIPWLKLEVTSHKGTGQLSDVTTVQRINTVGGVLKGSCDREKAGLGMPYAADYVFLRKS